MARVTRDGLPIVTNETAELYLRVGPKNTADTTQLIINENPELYRLFVHATRYVADDQRYYFQEGMRLAYALLAAQSFANQQTASRTE